MDQKTYEEKLATLVEVFQGDAAFAKGVLQKWLQMKKADIEAAITAEVSSRLEGLNSIIPVNLRVIIDGQGVRLVGGKPAAASAPAPAAKRRKAEIDKKNPLFEP